MVRLERPERINKDRYRRRGWLDTCRIESLSAGACNTQFTVVFDCDADHCPAFRRRCYNRRLNTTRDTPLVAVRGPGRWYNRSGPWCGKVIPELERSWYLNYPSLSKTLALRTLNERLCGREFSMLKRMHGADVTVLLPVLGCSVPNAAGFPAGDMERCEWEREDGPPKEKEAKKKGAKGKKGAAGKAGAKGGTKGGKKAAGKAKPPKGKAKPKGKKKK
jgi:hypothetical protein